jgi:hypothetical protein
MRLLLSEKIGSVDMELFLEIADVPELDIPSSLLKECANAAEDGVREVYNRYYQHWVAKGLLKEEDDE